LIIDPVLAEKFDGLTFDFKFMNRPVIFTYHMGEKSSHIVVNGEKVKTGEISNRYRIGGMRIK
jgi:1,2-beta-oligoglucan phosphorylase